jgi:hypothetical protein
MEIQRSLPQSPTLLDGLAESTSDFSKPYSRVIIDDLGMRKLPLAAHVIIVGRLEEISEGRTR